VADGLLLAGLVATGGSGWLAGGVGAGIVALESTRAWSARRGAIGRLTPGERPTRLILVGLAMAGAGGWSSQAGVIVNVALGASAVVVWMSWALLAIDVRARRGR
jgi:hypothetical protein